jgi:hypothetical protein
VLTGVAVSKHWSFGNPTSRRSNGAAMDSTLSKVRFSQTGTLIKVLFLMVLVSACTLSIKAAYDLSKDPQIFPVWFVPSFILIIIMLIALSSYFVLQAWKTDSKIQLVTNKQSAYLWIFVILSFVCTTAVHGFYPFQRDVLSILPMVDSVMKINYAVAITGLIGCTAFAILYFSVGTKPLALIGLLLIALITLIPNDNCANPFNYWWIETIGASPLMYVPNMYAALFVGCGLYGVHAKGAGFIATCICLGSLLLGIGHQLGIIW